MEKPSGMFVVGLFGMVLLTVVRGLVIFNTSFVCPTGAGLKMSR